MKKILPFALFWISLIGFAQCPITEVYLETQADIDNFAANYPRCSILTNTIWIGARNSNITNLNGLASITSAQKMSILGTQINDFSGLSNLVHLTELLLWFNSNIQNLDGLTSLESIGHLEVFVNPSIVDLSGMDSIDTIEEIFLFSNQVLADISHFSFLETINILSINNNAISSLAGLENLHTVYEDLLISNESLENFNELSGIQAIGGSLKITSTPLLNDVTAFSNIGSLRELYVVNCPSLSSFSGLENIQSISGRLRIGSNNSLIDMSDFRNLNSIGDIDILENDSLESLSGLENLQSVSNRFFIGNNMSLTSIEAISDLSTSDVNEVVLVNNASLAVCNNLFVCTVMTEPSVLKTIFNNDLGCSSRQEVSASCILSISDIVLNEAIAVYPNPVSELLQVDVSEGIILERIAVFSILGQQLIHSRDGVLDFSSLSQGVYFVEVITDQGRVTKKVLKE
jgi:hypothetical protein